ncbi:MAG: hypothetical protein K2X03_27590 [Bryobacteraceae bacterium]|nr:hypothetical protein [Bryobacteraceae bacterium]
MQQFLTLLDAWWLENPAATVFVLVVAFILLLLLLLPLAILASPRMRIYYRAITRILWTKIGDTRHGPLVPKVYQQYLDKKRIPQLLVATEAAAFGRTGAVYLSSDEIGFVSQRFGLMTEKTVPYGQVSVAMIRKAALYDLVTITTRERAEVLRIYRADRDVGQEFFNHLQMRLGAMRYSDS